MSPVARRFASLLPSALAASLCIAAPLVATLPAAGPASRDLSGSWTLNPGLSQEPPRGGMEDGTRPTGPVGGGMGGGGGAMGGMGGGRPGGGPMSGAGGAGMDPERMRRARDTMRELMDAPEHLSIANDGNTVVIEAPDGSRERLVADGKKYPHTLDAGDVTNRAAWKDGVLRVETTTKDGIKVERRFALESAADGTSTRLVVTYVANMPMARRPMEVKKVYDRAPE